MNNIDKAQTWLKKHCRGFYGDNPQRWTEAQKDAYHRDLGLLVNFVTDCFPDNETPSKEVPIDDSTKSISADMCKRCGINPRMPGYGMCRSCLGQAVGAAYISPETGCQCNCDRCRDLRGELIGNIGSVPYVCPTCRQRCAHQKDHRQKCSCVAKPIGPLLDEQ